MAHQTNAYCDGGLIGKNPSPIGGTWAFCLVERDQRTLSMSGLLLPTDIGQPVTNNVTELYAAVRALAHLPDGWNGTVYTDSLITLRRLLHPRRAAMNGVPSPLVDELCEHSGRMGTYQVVLLRGHPTKKELKVGFADRGGPVSVHNVHCDALCSQEAERYAGLCLSGVQKHSLPWRAFVGGVTDKQAKALDAIAHRHHHRDGFAVLMELSGKSAGQTARLGRQLLQELVSQAFRKYSR
jgi:ribonuclease HI